MRDVLPLKPRRGSEADEAARRKRDRARPFLTSWLKTIETVIRDRRLSGVDGRLARVLTGVPSANDGFCWARQDWLAGRLGRSDRTIRYSIARLEAAGFLSAKQRGWNRSCLYTFMMNGKPLIPGPEGVPQTHPQEAATRRRQAPGKKLPPVTSKKLPLVTGKKLPPDPLESDPLEQDHSPLLPPTPAAGDCSSGETASGLAIEGSQESNPEREAVRAWFDAEHYPGYADQLVEELHQRYPQFSRDEIWRKTLPPLMERVPGPIPTFESVWDCCTEPRGQMGPARAAWMKLTDDEQEQIGLLVFGQHIVDTRGVWLCTWLKARGWQAPPAKPLIPNEGNQAEARPETLVGEVLGPDINRGWEQPLSPSATHVGIPRTSADFSWDRRRWATSPPMLAPYSEEWKAERARRVARREPVSLMDDWARRGLGWPA